MENSEKKRSLLDSISLSSAEDFDISCQPCSFEGADVISEGYCQTCNEYLCKTCLAVHRKQSATRNHSILGKDELLNNKTKSDDTCSEVCTIHAQEILTLFCKIHDVVGCTECMALDHKTCDIERVSNVSDIYEDVEKEIVQELEQFGREIKQTKADLATANQYIDDNCSKLKQSINDFREALNKCLDEMENSLILEVNRTKEENENIITETTKELQSLETNLKQLSIDKENRGKTRNDLFVSLKQAKEKISYLKMSHSHLKTKKNVQLCEFREDEILSKLLSNDANIGTVKMKEHDIFELKTMQGVEIQESIIEMESSYQGKIEVKLENEKTETTISGIAVLSADELVVADSRQDSIKVIYLQNNTIKQSLNVKAAPYDVTCYDATNIVTTIPSRKRIKFIAYRNGMLSEDHEIDVDAECYGISHFSEGFVISFRQPEKVDLIDLQGNVLRSVMSDPTGNPLFIKPNYIDICQSADTIYVSDEELQEVVVMTSEGKVLNRYKESAWPHGLFVFNDGNFLVSMYIGDISVISRECVKQKTVIAKKDNLKWASAICYSYKHRKLFVSNENGRYINVYKFK